MEYALVTLFLSSMIFDAGPVTTKSSPCDMPGRNEVDVRFTRKKKEDNKTESEVRCSVQSGNHVQFAFFVKFASQSKYSRVLYRLENRVRETFFVDSQSQHRTSVTVAAL